MKKLTLLISIILCALIASALGQEIVRADAKQRLRGTVVVLNNLEQADATPEKVANLEAQIITLLAEVTSELLTPDEPKAAKPARPGRKPKKEKADQ